MRHTLPLGFVIALGGALLALPDDGSAQVGKLDRSGAFFHARHETERRGQGESKVLAELDLGPIDSAMLARYAAARLGRRALNELAFDLVLAHECKARGLARSAPTLARSLATRRFFEAGRNKKTDPDGRQRLKFLNDALRELRVAALIRAARTIDDWAVRALFERRYGVGGQRVRVRQVLISFDRIEQELRKAETDCTRVQIRKRARARASELRQQLRDQDLSPLLRFSHDRQTQRMLRHEATRERAGFLEGYNYVRYGNGFAQAVRALEVGEVSRTIESSTGMHLVQVTQRTITRFDDVAKKLHEEMSRRKVTSGELRGLRRRLLTKHGYRRR